MDQGLVERDIEKFYWYPEPSWGGSSLCLSYLGGNGSYYIPGKTLLNSQIVSDTVIYQGDSPGLHPEKVRFIGYPREHLTYSKLLQAWLDGLWVYQEFNLAAKPSIFWYDPEGDKVRAKRELCPDGDFSLAPKKIVAKPVSLPRRITRAFGFFVKFSS